MESKINKLKIGTVFSGIGAFEQAINLLEIEHELIFACDNGGILLEKIIKENEKEELEKIENKLDKLNYIENIYKKCKSKNFVKKSFLENYNLKEENFYSDIRFVGSHINKEIDILVGGSPCQSFSVAGKRGGFEDTRGTLFFEYARCVKEFNPKVFIYENVNGLINHDNGKTFETVLNTFNELGYNYFYKVLNSKDYLIPQSRKRIFIIGFREDLCIKEFNFPEKKELKLKVKDLLEDNVDVKFYYNDDKGIKNNNVNTIRKRNDKERGNNREYKNGLCPTLTAYMGTGGNNVPVINPKYFLSSKMEKFVMSSCGEFNKNPTIDTDIAKCLLASMVKMHRASIDNYVKTNGKIRKLTPRECLRLMGFPDSFKIVVSDSQMYKQCGNSIVVTVLMYILEEIIKKLEENKLEIN